MKQTAIFTSYLSCLCAPSILGDSSLHQPIGQQLAASAASAMAKALGEAQTSGMSSSGPQGPSGADPLTHYLAKISRHQLSQVMTEMKALATQNGPLARQLLQSSLQLPKALFQAQIMLNMVTPQMLQMPNLRQPSLDGLEAQKPIIPPFHGQSVTQPGILAKLPDGQVSGLAQSHLIPVQPQLQHLPSAQAQHLSQAVLLGKPGVPAFSQPLGGLSVSPLTSVVTSKGLLQQIQTPSLQQDRPIAPTAGGIHSNISIQQPLSGRLPSTQRIPSAHIPGEHGAYASLSYDSAWGSQARMAQDGDHPSKRLKLEEVTSAPQAGGGAAFRTRGGLAQAADTGLPAASQMIGADGTQQPDKQALQLPQDMHKVLLEQVKSLTAEQLSLLPPEQRQQVIDLQQRLRLLEGLDAAS
ncbi:unnamed protein product [Spirodela intermedia]|uniref:Uncharacterized protein n=1 Tax=Spirodela intermedia TaxID=51605 RepID=A0A7I8L5H6_SPIIN|nr:unnamed protein product [Spirodela intermedia]